MYSKCYLIVKLITAYVSMSILCVMFAQCLDPQGQGFRIYHYCDYYYYYRGRYFLKYFIACCGSRGKTSHITCNNIRRQSFEPYANASVARGARPKTH